MRHDFLYRFIQALDKAEVHCCRGSVFFSSDRWSAQRSAAFNSLHGQKEYDPEALKSAINNADYSAIWPYEKKRMYRSLLATVLDHRRRKEDTDDPCKHLEESRLLMSMGLPDEAAEMAMEGIELAMKVEDILTELALREHLREVYKALPRKAIIDAITQNEYRLEMAGHKVQNLIHYTLIGDKLGDYHKRFRIADRINVREAMHKLVVDPFMVDMKHAMSLPAQIKFAYGWGFYYESAGMHDKANEFYHLVLSLWESNPARIASLPHLYRAAISNLIGQLLSMGQTSEVPALLNKMERIPTTGRRSEMLAFGVIELQYQLYYMNTDQLELALTREDGIVKGLKTFGRLMTESNRLTLLYNLGVTVLLAGDVRKAKDYFTQIHDLGELHSRLDLQGLARIWRLLLLMELDKDDGFPHYIRNSRRFFNADHPTYPMEDVVYNWMKRYHTAFHSKEAKSLLFTLNDELLPFEKQKLSGAQELRLWAMSRATGKDIRELFATTLR